NDGKFAVGGSFDQGFAFAGGRFMVVPASRPPSTYAHEAAHMFWGLDEYAGGSTYTAHRGYYDTINVNAEGNPEAGFVQAPSIMALDRISGNPNVPSTFPRTEAYAAHTSSQSSLEMIGWKDSDGDGIFDVLDVPFTLTGSGHYDSSLGRYRFNGESSVRTFANQNPAGLKNDITINRIRVVEYAIDDGPWTVYQAFPDRTYKTALDVSVPMSPGEHTIKIRTHDTRTGVMSPEFIGHTSGPSSAPQSGIGGFVYTDTDGDGTWDDGEAPLAGWDVGLVDAFGGPVILQRRIEPDDSVEGTPLGSGDSKAKLTAVGSDAGRDEVQRLTFSGTGGTVTPLFQGVLGSPIEVIPGVAPTAQDLQGILETIGALSGNVQVSGPAGGPLMVKFGGELGHTDVPLILQGASTGNAGLSPATTTEGISDDVFALSSQSAPAAQKVFAAMSLQQGGSPVETWTSNSRMLRVDFSDPIAAVSLRAIAGGAASIGRLEAYDAAGKLIERYTTGVLTAGKQELMTIQRPTPDIAYVLARSHLGTEVILDTLTWGPNSSTTTDAQGAYSLPNLDSGLYRVKLTPPEGHVVTSPSGGVHTVQFTAGQNASDLNFGLHRLDFSNPWHNLVLAENVNNDPGGLVNVLDLLAIVNWITAQGGIAQLPPAGDTQANGYVDVDNNGICNVLDVLAVVNYITVHYSTGTGGGAGENLLGRSESLAGSIPGQAASPQGEGETLSPIPAAAYYAVIPWHYLEAKGDDELSCAAEEAGHSSPQASPAPPAAPPLPAFEASAAPTAARLTPPIEDPLHERLDESIALLAADIAQSRSTRSRLARRYG
ncbi:MAG TPA: hypothetical protein VFV87_07285, partial [Pirellulaceae bacterium]|nr:hypothetical protein [Pirellulaceae bacterium]